MTKNIILRLFYLKQMWKRYKNVYYFKINIRINIEFLK